RRVEHGGLDRRVIEVHVDVLPQRRELRWHDVDGHDESLPGVVPQQAIPLATVSLAGLYPAASRMRTALSASRLIIARSWVRSPPGPPADRRTRRHTCPRSPSGSAGSRRG